METKDPVELDYKLEHPLVIEKYGIDKKKLPTSIKDKLRAVNHLCLAARGRLGQIMALVNYS